MAGLFKKKAGGTLIGNLARIGLSKATGGVLGTGANRIEVGQTQTNAQLAEASGSQQYSKANQRFIDNIIEPDQTNMLYWIIGGVTAVLLGVLAYTQGLFSKKSKSWRR